MTSIMPDVSFSDGLRKLADMLDEHPEIEVSSHRQMIFCATLEEFIAQVRAFGPQNWRVEKDVPYYRLVAHLGGGVSVMVYTYLKNVLTQPVGNVPIRADVLALTEAER